MNQEKSAKFIKSALPFISLIKYRLQAVVIGRLRKKALMLKEMDIVKSNQIYNMYKTKTKQHWQIKLNC